jgi:hypothetical protein
MQNEPSRFHRYAARSIRFLELWEPGGWRIKVYGISHRPTPPSAPLVEAARAAARGILVQPAVSPGRYGIGFMGVHEGRGENLVFVDWWGNENELFHHVFVSSPRAPGQLEDVTMTSRSACVWDLAVIDFERRAWIRTVLSRPEDPDLEEYLRAHLEGVQ